MRPTEAEHAVDVEDLLVSATDGEGTIRQVDDAFIRVSGYSREQLIGAPHGIVRHPVVPGGALYLMWQAVRAGDPFTAYVVNRAADGGRYRGFWTVMPLPDGTLLSVVSKPMVSDALELTLSVFETTADLEEQLIASGVGPEEAAARGADQIIGLLADAGMGSATDVAVGVLPVEVESLDESLGRCLRTGSGPQETLGRLDTVRDALRATLSRLDAIASTLDAMAPDIATIRDQGDRVRALVSRPGRLRSPAAGPGSLTVPIAPAVGGGMDALLHLLEGDLERIRRRAAAAAFRGGLALLHTRAAAHVMGERLDDPAAREASLAVVPTLCDAMTVGLGALVALLRVTAAAADLAGARIEEAAGLVRTATASHDAADLAILQAVLTEVETTDGALARMAARVAECRRAADGAGLEQARSAVQAVRDAVLRA